MTTARCQALVQCRTHGTAAGYLLQRCVQGERGFEVDANDIKKAVAAGRLKYDGTKAQGCLDATNAGFCSSLDSLDPAACSAVLVGTVKAGGTCSSVEPECEKGTTCIPDGSSRCAGICVADAAEGRSCEQADCAEGFFCDDASTPRICVKRGDVGAACPSPGQCKEGLSCVSQKCAAPGQAGASCDRYFATSTCAKGFYCLAQQLDATTGAWPGTCKAQIAAGSECGEGSECVSGLVCRGAFLGPGNTVTAGSCTDPVDEGGSCVNNKSGTFTITGCRYGLICQSGKCTRPPTTGPCSDDFFFTCDSAYCDKNSNTCKPRKADGASCVSDDECINICADVAGVMTCTTVKTLPCHEP